VKEGSPLRLERRPDGTAILWFDLPGEKMNLLRPGFEEHLGRALDEMEADAGIRAAVLASGKPDGFIAGADVKVLQGLGGAAEAAALSRRAQEALGRLESCRVPVVAAVHGACVGGGLELVLACRGRVASDAEETRLGLPEVRLGVIPGAGGTQRLPRLVGLSAALDLILTGKQIPARKALAIGLVDEVVPRPILLEAALERARRLAAGEPGRRPRRGLWRRAVAALLEGNPAGRAFVYRRARRAILAETRGNLPAPPAALEAVREGIERGPERGYAAEAEAFGRLAVTPEARHLMALFFAVTELRKDSGVADPAVAPREVRKVGVLGAGLMGSGIAFVTAAEAGLPVRLKDVGHEPLRKALGAIRGLLSERAARRRQRAAEVERRMMLIRPTTDYSGFRRADVVIEAVVEDLEVKRRVLAETEAAAGPGAIFATNTSSIPIDRIADGARRPGQVVGMHYFSPVDKVPLLEVVAGKRTEPWVVATSVALGKAQGKTVIVVRDGPGFYTTRILGPYVNEAGYLLAEGVPVEEIDEALLRFGFPVGPLKLLDEVGIDTGHKIAKVLHEAFGDRMAPAPALEKVFADGRAGRKNGRGFYRYGEAARGKAGRRVDPTVYDVIGARPAGGHDPEAIARRLVLPMVNEAVRCFAEGILRSARDGDVGAVLGLGFPPFRGGPFRYLDGRGAAAVRAELEELRRRHGERFAPAPLLEDLARGGKKIYDLTPGSPA
jgi:3-hydroxyacyl-CoA dehydrogenase/enoyl-CoA hydratase/3-hydroxybutyryl-CoA epimerase